MARIFITGSADGLGQLAARRLVALGHDVVLHGRNGDRAQQALRAAPGARTALEGDLASIEQTRELAGQANAAGPFQAVIHNAGVYRPGAASRETVDGLDDVFAINALAPYLLTALIERPRGLIYLTSGLPQGGGPDLARLHWPPRTGTGLGGRGVGGGRRGSGTQTCSSRCGHAPRPASGRKSSRTRSILDGFPRRWAARPRPATWSKASRPKCGWPSARSLGRK